MQLPADAIIAKAKFTEYLLVRQSKGDKSKFLARAGYTLKNPNRLETDLREQILNRPATRVVENKFGQYYEIRGELQGPNGKVLRIRTIWISERLSGQTKFVTLYPLKQPS